MGARGEGLVFQVWRWEVEEIEVRGMRCTNLDRSRFDTRPEQFVRQLIGSMQT